MKKLVVQLKTQLDQMISSSCQIMAGQNIETTIPNQELLGKLLLAGLKNEWETSQLSMLWAQSEKEPSVAMMYSRLAGDEAKHFLWIKELLQSRNIPLFSIEQLNERSPLFLELEKIESSFERIVAGPFLREALAVERNRIFLEFCTTIDAIDVLDTYNKIQQDEKFHHEMGCELLYQTVSTEQHYKIAQRIIETMIRTIDDIQEMLIIKKKLIAVPGC